ncbi:hypothetical protein FS320_41290 [Microvirga tunisiensis]|uniref:Uncharacterized protein n=1 Tax=Microvirga tunisiensis TaxID=2108360 RepID=A0A5N7N869_9HYPH|nr:hypothetical protein [Microvirga tunisiensis]MPR31166.1 hypothetical protein [Microvirga tunisiensis]
MGGVKGQRPGPIEALKKRKRNFEKWFREAGDKHGDSFDYSKAAEQFETQKQPQIEIQCKEHDQWFTVTPFGHVQRDGGGCPVCGPLIRGAVRKNNRAAQFRADFAERYPDYELVSPYLGATESITVRCRKHAMEFPATPNGLNQGMAFGGCKECAREGRQQRAAERRITLDDTLKLQPCLPAHVKIIGLDTSYTPTRVIIECEKHGQDRVPKGYLTRKGSHGCPQCGDERVGYTEHRLKHLLATGERGEPCRIGVMDVEVFGIQSVKVGFTSRTLEARYGIALKAIHFSAQLDEIDAIALETEIHSQFNRQSDLRILKAGMRNGGRWGGDTECYWPGARSARPMLDFG